MVIITFHKTKLQESDPTMGEILRTQTQKTNPNINSLAVDKKRSSTYNLKQQSKMVTAHTAVDTCCA